MLTEKRLTETDRQTDRRTRQCLITDLSQFFQRAYKHFHCGRYLEFKSQCHLKVLGPRS